MQFTNLSILEARDVNEIVALNKRLSIDYPGIDWINDVIEHPLDDYVKEQLLKSSAALVSRPNSLAYDPCAIHENLSEATRLLEANIQRFEEIKRLEYEATQSVLDILKEEASADSAHRLVTLQVKANVAQLAVSGDIGGDPLNYSDAVNDQFAIAKRFRVARVEMQQKQGSALNFLERIIFQRELFLDTILNAYERLHACRIGLANAFGINSREVPEWQSGRSDSLLELVKWLREVIYLLDSSEKDEFEFDHFIFVGRDKFKEGDIYVDGKLKIFDYSGATQNTLEFKFEWSDLPGALNITDKDAIRILSIGVAPTFGEAARFCIDHAATLHTGTTAEGITQASKHDFAIAFLKKQRDRLSFTFDVQLPTQTVRLDAAHGDGALHSWPRHTLRFCGVGGWFGGSLSDSLSQKSSKQALNAFPIGDWKISLDTTVMDTYRTWSAGALGETYAGIKDIGLDDLSNPHDIVIGLRLAVRRGRQ